MTLHLKIQCISTKMGPFLKVDVSQHNPSRFGYVNPSRYSSSRDVRPTKQDPFLISHAFCVAHINEPGRLKVRLLLEHNRVGVSRVGTLPEPIAHRVR